MTWTSMLSKWPRPRYIHAAVAVSGRLMPALLQDSTPLHDRLA